jgi:hypothetical protein
MPGHPVLLPSVHLGPDLYASPLWTPGQDGKLENRQLNEFPISRELADELKQWAAACDLLIEPHEGTALAHLPEAKALDRAGEELWRRLVAELGEEREVHYDSPIYGESHLVHRPDVS